MKFQKEQFRVLPKQKEKSRKASSSRGNSKKTLHSNKKSPEITKTPTILLLLLIFIIKERKALFPPNGRCKLHRTEDQRTYTSTTSNQQMTMDLTCGANHNSFQFMIWIKLTADVPNGQLWYFMRYHTIINLYFKPLGGGEHEILLTKTDESPMELGQVYIGKKDRWLFVWLQVTPNQASLAVRSTMNWELENNRIYHYPFSKRINYINFALNRVLIFFRFFKFLADF